MSWPPNPLAHSIRGPTSATTLENESGSAYIHARSGPASPQDELFEAQPQLVVVTEELGVLRDLVQEDLGHLQGSLRNRERWQRED